MVIRRVVRLPVTKLLLIFAGAIVLVALIKAQGAGIEFGREPGVPPHGRNQTRLTGRADHVTTSLGTTVYRGNVKIWFPDAGIVLSTDEAVSNDETHELTFSGNVRLKLDTK